MATNKLKESASSRKEWRCMPLNLPTYHRIRASKVLGGACSTFFDGRYRGCGALFSTSDGSNAETKVAIVGGDAMVDAK